MIIEIEGELWDEETGEYAGPVSSFIEGSIDTEAVALQVMRKWLDYEADLKAETLKLDAVRASIEKIVKTKASRLEWLKRTYGTQIEEWALRQLPKGSKTWRCPWGSIAFRTTAQKVSIIDDVAVLTWARKHQPQMIRVKESLLISALTAEAKTQMVNDPTAARAIGFEIIEAGQSATIKTGIGE
jgi:hypothetical protein